MSLENQEYQTSLRPGESVAFYVNLSELETNANFSSWSIDLYNARFPDELGALAWPNILSATKDVISGSSYRFYFAEQTVNIDVPVGCYRILITDTTTGSVLYMSERIEVTTDTTDTLRIRYRNARNILNYNYEGLPSFKNLLRIPLLRRKPAPTTNSIGFQRASGKFKSVRVQLGQTWEFVTGWFDGDAIEAFNDAINHSTFEVNVKGEWLEHNVTEESSVTPDFQEDYPLIETAVRLEQTSKATSNKQV